MAIIKTRKEIEIEYNIDEVKMIEIEIKRLVGNGFEVLDQFHPSIDWPGCVELLYTSEKEKN